MVGYNSTRHTIEIGFPKNESQTMMTFVSKGQLQSLIILGWDLPPTKQGLTRIPPPPYINFILHFSYSHNMGRVRVYFIINPIITVSNRFLCFVFNSGFTTASIMKVYIIICSSFEVSALDFTTKTVHIFPSDT